MPRTPYNSSSPGSASALGEAGCTPPAHSLITDIVPRERRASALALYAMGAPLGGLLGMAMGGIIAAQWGWRAVFLVAGAPGILLAAVAFFTLAEPRRKAMRALVAPEPPALFWPTIRMLLANRTFVLVALGGAAASFVFYGLGAFYASFFLRNHDIELQLLADRAGMKPLGLLGVALGGQQRRCRRARRGGRRASDRHLGKAQCHRQRADTGDLRDGGGALAVRGHAGRWGSFVDPVNRRSIRAQLGLGRAGSMPPRWGWYRPGRAPRHRR